MNRVNIGCGKTPTPGWKNYDNSPSLRLASMPRVVNLLNFVGLLAKQQKDFVTFAKNTDIRWANATKLIPEADKSVEVIYTCSMFEYFDKKEADSFFKEAKRTLVQNGILRIAVPDIGYLVNNYLNDGDADKFMVGTCLRVTRPKSLSERLRYVLFGDRINAFWMYDGRSLCRLLMENGFKEPQVMAPGTTRIVSPKPLNLYERYPGYVYVEALNP